MRRLRKRQEKDSDSSKIANRLTIISLLLTFIGVLLTLTFSSITWWYTHQQAQNDLEQTRNALQQTEITRENNYFQTIINIQGMENELEFLAFAYNDAPKKYGALIKYYIYKEPKLLEKLAFEALDDNLKLALIRLIMDMVNDNIKAIDGGDVLNSLLNKDFSDIRKKYFPLFISFLEKNKTEVFRLNALNQDDKSNISKMVYWYFNLLISGNIHNSEHSGRHYLPVLNIAHIQFAFLDEDVTKLINLLSMLLGEKNYIVEHDGSLSARILTNLSLALVTQQIWQDAEFEKKLKQKFSFLTDVEAKDNSFKRNYKLRLYYWLSVLHLKKAAGFSRYLGIESFIEANLPEDSPEFYGKNDVVFGLNALETIYFSIKDNLTKKEKYSQFLHAAPEAFNQKCFFDGKNIYRLDGETYTEKEKTVSNSYFALEHRYGLFLSQSFKDKMFKNEILQKISGTKIVECGEGVINLFD